jgi:hypothetical protein
MARKQNGHLPVFVVQRMMANVTRLPKEQVYIQWALPGKAATGNIQARCVGLPRKSGHEKRLRREYAEEGRLGWKRGGIRCTHRSSSRRHLLRSDFKFVQCWLQCTVIFVRVGLSFSISLLESIGGGASELERQPGITMGLLLKRRQRYKVALERQSWEFEPRISSTWVLVRLCVLLLHSRPSNT